MTTALLLIDLQNDYFPGGTMELVGAEAAVARAAALLAAFRRRGAPVVHVQHVATEADATFFLPGTRGAEIHAAVRPAPGETLVVKHHPSAFRDTPLRELLAQRGVTRLVVAGMMTQMCVDTTVRAAADLGFECRLAADACATLDLSHAGETVRARDVQLAYLAALDGVFAAVLPTEALLAEGPAADAAR